MISALRVFSNRLRTDASPAGHSEPTFAFLDRVAGEYWDQVRDLVEEWVSAFPVHARADVVGRLKDKHHEQLLGAFWELYLHQMFLRSGHDVIVHPAVPGASQRPDFFVDAGGKAFYVEAKTIVGATTNSSEAARKTRLYDSIDKIDCANFFLRIDVNAVGPTDLPTKLLRRALESWVASLDPDAMIEAGVRHESVDRFPWSSDGWELEFRPLPIRADQRGRSDHRVLGLFGPVRAAYVNDDLTLRAALRDKGSAYGKLDHPLVIAINSFAPSHDDADSISALYGTEQISVSLDDVDAEPIASRKPDGYWLEDTWAHRHIAGVLLCRSMTPWRAADESPTLWLHPQPNGFVTPLRQWRVARVVGDHIEYRAPDGSVAQLFGLRKPWPIGDAFPRESLA